MVADWQYIIDRFGGGKMIPPSGTPERLRYTYWYVAAFLALLLTGRRIHYAEANFMSLNLIALVFTRMPDQAPFFVKPLLKAIAKKAETGIHVQDERRTYSSILWSAIKNEFGVHRG